MATFDKYEIVVKEVKQVPLQVVIKKGNGEEHLCYNLSWMPYSKYLGEAIKFKHKIFNNSISDEDLETLVLSVPVVDGIPDYTKDIKYTYGLNKEGVVRTIDLVAYFINEAESAEE